MTGGAAQPRAFRAWLKIAVLLQGFSFGGLSAAPEKEKGRQRRAGDGWDS